MSGSEPKLLGDGRFSMIKLSVNRTTLTPTIKPFSREADPEEIRRQQELQRQQDTDEADDLRRLLDDVRQMKRDGVEDWQQQMQPPGGAFAEDLSSEPDGAPRDDGEVDRTAADE